MRTRWNLRDSSPKKKSEELIEKLCRLTSVYEAEALQEGFCANNGKSCNESIYYIADTINAAIAKRKKIAFYYFHYGPGKNRVLKNDGSRMFSAHISLFGIQMNITL